MSFLQLNENDSASMYIKHSFQLGKFLVNDEPVDVDYMLIHPDFKTGLAVSKLDCVPRLNCICLYCADTRIPHQ